MKRSSSPSKASAKTSTKSSATTAVAAAASPEATLAKLQGLITSRASAFAWKNYKPVILEMAKGKRVLEIGAGRSPLFSPDELKRYAITYTANDIWQSELDRISFKVATACFDATQDVPAAFEGKFDLVFSQMVQEHVASGPRYYHNLHKLLAKGGVSLQFHPTLYHPVFILNYLLPETLSARILQFFFPQRNWDETPKFPAYYQYCTTLPGQVKVLAAHGFRIAHQFPFYGQGYFKKIPGFKQLFSALDGWAMAKDIRALSTYAFSVVIK